MALGFTSLAAVMLGAAAHRHAPWMLAPAAVMFVVAAAVWLHARRRGRDLSLRTTSRPLRLLTLAIAVAAVVAAVMAIVAPR